MVDFLAYFSAMRLSLIARRERHLSNYLILLKFFSSKFIFRDFFPQVSIYNKNLYRNLPNNT